MAYAGLAKIYFNPVRFQVIQDYFQVNQACLHVNQVSC